jgi:Ulp1 family protease
MISGFGHVSSVCRQVNIHGGEALVKLHTPRLAQAVVQLYEQDPPALSFPATGSRMHTVRVSRGTQQQADAIKHRIALSKDEKSHGSIGIKASLQRSRMQGDAQRRQWQQQQTATMATTRRRANDSRGCTASSAISIEDDDYDVQQPGAAAADHEAAGGSRSRRSRSRSCPHGGGGGDDDDDDASTEGADDGGGGGGGLELEVEGGCVYLARSELRCYSDSLGDEKAVLEFTERGVRLPLDEAWTLAEAEIPYDDIQSIEMGFHPARPFISLGFTQVSTRNWLLVKKGFVPKSCDESHLSRLTIPVQRHAPMREVFDTIRSIQKASGLGSCAELLGEVPADRVDRCLEGLRHCRGEGGGAAGAGRGGAGDDAEREVLCIYPSQGKDRVMVTRADLRLLEPGQFLNDTIVDFYLKHLEIERRDKELKCLPSSDDASSPRFLFVNSFFYTKLMTKPLAGQQPIDIMRRLRRWTVQGHDGASLFTRPYRAAKFGPSYLFVPICENLHWSLAVVVITYGDEKSTTLQQPIEIDTESSCAADGRETVDLSHSEGVADDASGIGGSSRSVAKAISKGLCTVVDSVASAAGGLVRRVSGGGAAAIDVDDGEAHDTASSSSPRHPLLRQQEAAESEPARRLVAQSHRDERPRKSALLASSASEPVGTLQDSGHAAPTAAELGHDNLDSDTGREELEEEGEGTDHDEEDFSAELPSDDDVLIQAQVTRQEPPHCEAAEAEHVEVPHVQLLWFDSLGRKNPPACKKVVKFLNFAWNRHQKLAESSAGDAVDYHLDNDDLESPWRLASPRISSASRLKKVSVVHKLVPRQANGHDCGVFVLEYVERFLEDSVIECRKGHTALRRFHDSADHSGWFNPTDIELKRQTLQGVIHSLVPLADRASSHCAATANKRTEAATESRKDRDCARAEGSTAESASSASGPRRKRRRSPGAPTSQQEVLSSERDREWRKTVQSRARQRHQAATPSSPKSGAAATAACVDGHAAVRCDRDSEPMQEERADTAPSSSPDVVDLS